MFKISGAFGGYMNHCEEKEAIIRAAGEGKPFPKVGDFYSAAEVSEMENKVWTKYRVKADLSFLL